MNIITHIETDDKCIDLIYLDPSSLKSDNVSLGTKSVVLTKRDADFNEEKYIINYLSNTLKPIDIEHPQDKNKSLYSFTPNDYELTETNVGFLEKKFIFNLTLSFYYIAAQGCIGVPNTIIINQKTYDNWFDNDYIDITTDLYLKNILFIINNDIIDNEILVIENTGKDSPGYKYITTTDKDCNFYADVIRFGFYPDRYAVKFKIYE